MDHRLSLDSVLRNLVKYDIPKLYPGEEKNIILHFDNATAHVYPAVVALLQECKVKFITKEKWMSNSPDLPPLDYAVNGFFKDQCLLGFI